MASRLKRSGLKRGDLTGFEHWNVTYQCPECGRFYSLRTAGDHEFCQLQEDRRMAGMGY